VFLLHFKIARARREKLRTNLLVPFKEKDQAKALGASWDSGRKIWYVENKENLEPFLRWMPKHLKKPCR
jgi:hypothetical protein